MHPINDAFARATVPGVPVLLMPPTYNKPVCTIYRGSKATSVDDKQFFKLTKNSRAKLETLEEVKAKRQGAHLGQRMNKTEREPAS